MRVKVRALLKVEDSSLCCTRETNVTCASTILKLKKLKIAGEVLFLRVVLHLFVPGLFQILSVLLIFVQDFRVCIAFSDTSFVFSCPFSTVVLWYR